MKNKVNNNAVKKLLFFIFFLLSTILIFWLGSELGWLNIFENQDAIQATITKAGLFGPLLIIILIAAAIIISPIPSAPIALVSGLLYGHLLGTVYIVAGALLGAVLAFMISRKLGYDYVSKKWHNRIPNAIVGSQNTLMIIVFVTRLAPFISFDVISYAAGLTKLTFWRFLIATLMGIIPISFVLAHLGSEIKNQEFESIVTAILLLGAVTIIPALFNAIKISNSKGD